MKSKKLLIALLILMCFLTVPVAVFASDITNAKYYGTILISNNSTAETNVVAVANIDSQSLIDIYGVDEDFDRVAMRNSSGADVPFMPSVNSSYPWCMWVPAIGDYANINYILYTGNASLGATKYYFPGSTGMGTTDDDDLELGSDFEIEDQVFVDTSSGSSKDIVYKQDAFRTYVSGSGNITSAVLGSGDSEVVSVTAQAISSGEHNVKTYLASGNYTKQYIVGGNFDGSYYFATEWASLMGGGGFQGGDDSLRRQVIPIGGLLTDFKAEVKIAPGASKSWDFTIYVNGEDTSLSVQIADTANESSLDTDDVYVSAGDLVSIKRIATNTPPDSGAVYWTCRFTPNTIGETIILSKAEFESSTTYISPFGGAVDYDDLRLGESIIPTSGTIKKLQVHLNTTPGTGDSRVFTVYKNGVATDLAVTISNSDTTGSDTLHDFTVSANDTISIKNSIISTPANSCCQLGLVFVPDTQGEWIASSTHDNPPDSSTRYFYVTGSYNTGATEEAEAYQMARETTAKAVYATLYTSEEAGDSVNITLRKDATDTALTILMNEGETSANLTTDVSISNYELLDNKITTVGTCHAQQRCNIAYLFYNEPTSGDYLQIYIDDVLEDSTYFDGSVPDNSNNWFFCESAAVPYMQYHKITVDGVLRQYILWEYDTTFNDQSAYNNDAVPTFRTTGSDGDISASLTSWVPISLAQAPSYTVSDAPDFYTGNITATSNFTSGSVPRGGPPGAAVIDDVSTAGGTPNIWLWGIIGALTILMIGLFISYLEKTYGSGGGTLILRISVACFVMGLLVAFQKFDFWMIVIYLFIAIMPALASRHLDWGGHVTQLNLIGFLATAWIGLTIINRILEGQLITANERIWSNYFAFTQDFELFGIFTIPVLNFEFFTHGIPALIKWDYSFFGGNAQLLQYLLYSITAVVAFSIFIIIIGLLYNFLGRAR